MLLQMALFYHFLWLSNIPLNVCTTSFSSGNGCLGCFHILDIVNSASVNISVQVSFQIMLHVPFNSREKGLCG